MYFFYIDESGNLDCARHPVAGGGPPQPRDRYFVLTAVSLWEGKWHGFERTLNRKKRDLVDRIVERGGERIYLPDCEIKSSWLRNPKAVANHALLSHLYEAERTELVNLFYHQLHHNSMLLFAVVIDKAHLHDHFDQRKLHRKAWELLLERVEHFLAIEHPKNRGLLITDDISPSANRSLAEKHSLFLEQGTNVQLLPHLVEMPMFVRSELSNGVQLADLCAYNFYRAFSSGNFAYPWFERVLPSVWSSPRTVATQLEGLKVFPPESPNMAVVGNIGRRAAELRAQVFGSDR